MKFLASLAAHSAWNRRYTLGLTALAIALSCALLLGMERLRHDAHDSFAQSVSGTDLIVGARGSAIQLLLHAVFHIGEPGGNITWRSVQKLAEHPDVAWVIPLSLGDSHRGFPVIGTHPAYFDHFQYGAGQALRFSSGAPFSELFDVVLGAEVASRLAYRTGDPLTLAHGTGEGVLKEHGDKPFVVRGILARTGTPVDRSVHVSLEAIEALHLEWQGGVPLPGVSIPARFVNKFDLRPKSVSAVLLGLRQRGAVFTVQRQVAALTEEPLMAVLPGVALSELWQIVDVGERALRLVSALVVAVGLAGLIATILAGLDQRRRELAILRSVGARPRDIFLLLACEGLGVTLLGIALGLALQIVLALLFGAWLEAHHGITLSPFAFTSGEWLRLAALLLAGFIASLLPGYRAYRLSLADGLTPRL